MQEATDEQLVGDRIDMRETGEVTDDRGHARPPPPPRWQQRPRLVRTTHLDCHLVGEHEHLVVQQEEAREIEPRDDRELLLQALMRAGTQLRVTLAVATLHQRVAQLRQAPHRGRVLSAGIAITEVVPEVEGQRLGQPRRLGHGIGPAARMQHLALHHHQLALDRSDHLELGQAIGIKVNEESAME